MEQTYAERIYLFQLEKNDLFSLFQYGCLHVAFLPMYACILIISVIKLQTLKPWLSVVTLVCLLFHSVDMLSWLCLLNLKLISL